MKQYNSLNVKLSNSQLNKLKAAIKNESEVVLRLSSDMIGAGETNFLHKLLFTNRQVANLCKAFVNNSTTILSYQKLNYLRQCNQEDYLVNFLVHY